MTDPERRLLIDELALKILRRPSAAPSLKPREVIAVALAGTPWAEDRGDGIRIIDPDSFIIEAIVRCLDDAGYKIVPK